MAGSTSVRSSPSPSKRLPWDDAEAQGACARLSLAVAGVRWIPTGGVSAANAASYLALPVGGSWMVASELIAARDFATVTRLAREAIHLGTGEEP